MVEPVCGWCKGTGKLTGGRATYDCTICRDPNERKQMYDQQPKTPDPLKLAVALCGDSPTAEECRLAAQWIAEATRPKPAPVALTAEMDLRELKMAVRSLALLVKSELPVDSIAVRRADGIIEILDRLLNTK